MQFALIIQSDHVRGELGHQLVNSILCASSKIEYSIVLQRQNNNQSGWVQLPSNAGDRRFPLSASSISKKFCGVECAVECQRTWMNSLKNSLHKEKRAYTSNVERLSTFLWFGRFQQSPRNILDWRFLSNYLWPKTWPNYVNGGRERDWEKMLINCFLLFVRARA